MVAVQTLSRSKYSSLQTTRQSSRVLGAFIAHGPPSENTSSKEPEALRIYRETALRLIRTYGEDGFQKAISAHGHHPILSKLQRKLRLFPCEKEDEEFEMVFDSQMEMLNVVEKIKGQGFSLDIQFKRNPIGQFILTVKEIRPI